MKPELRGTPSGEQDEPLARCLLRVGGDQSVRALEALAAVFVNRLRVTPDSPFDGNEHRIHQPTSLREESAPFGAPAHARLQLCRRIARRALRGSLSDPTGGATAFHRVDASPDWSRRLLPVAVFGEFLFYRR